MLQRYKILVQTRKKRLPMHSKVGREIRGRDMRGEGIDLIGFVFRSEFFSPLVIGPKNGKQLKEQRQVSQFYHIAFIGNKESCVALTRGYRSFVPNPHLLQSLGLALLCTNCVFWLQYPKQEQCQCPTCACVPSASGCSTNTCTVF